MSADCSADRGQTGLVCCQWKGDLPGLVSLVPAARGGDWHTRSDGSSAAAPHDPDGNAECGATIRPAEPWRPARCHQDPLREPQHGSQLPWHAQSVLLLLHLLYVISTLMCFLLIFKWSVYFMSYLHIHLFFSLWFQSQRRTLPPWSTELRWWKGSSSLRCWTETPRTTTWITGSPDIPLRMTAGLGSRSNWARPPSSTTSACCCGTGTAGKTCWSHPGKINAQTVPYIRLFVVNIGMNTQVKFIVK